METFNRYAWVLLTLLVFIASFVDVTLGTMHIILLKNGNLLAAHLCEEGSGVTFVDGHGESGNPIAPVYSVVMRKELDQIIEIIEKVTPKIFYTAGELRSV